MSEMASHTRKPTFARRIRAVRLLEAKVPWPSVKSQISMGR
jgi:hypothetical protein